jgi:hypothetical protein
VRRHKNVLAFFYYTEVLIEMLATQSFGGLLPVAPVNFASTLPAENGRWKQHPKGKWLVVLLVELIK